MHPTENNWSSFKCKWYWQCIAPDGHWELWNCDTIKTEPQGKNLDSYTATDHVLRVAVLGLLLGMLHVYEHARSIVLHQ